MEKVTFGFDQIANTTPKVAVWFFRITLYAAAIANILISVIDEIPPETKAIIGKYSIYAVTIVHSISKMFGLEIEQPKYNFKA